MKKIFFVHGFGERWNARGLFTDIQKSLENIFSFEFLDLNKIEKENNSENVILNPLHIQAEILEKNILDKGLETENIIICHSQGCVVSSLLENPEKLNIRKIFFLAPPTNNDLEKSVKAFEKRPGTIVNFEGESILKRSDGSETKVPKEYWADRKTLNYLEIYKKIGEKIKKENIYTIFAAQDEIVDLQNISEFEIFSKTFKIGGNHNFEKESRTELIKLIKELL